MDDIDTYVAGLGNKGGAQPSGSGETDVDAYVRGLGQQQPSSFNSRFDAINQKPDEPQRSWSDVPLEAVGNIPSSAGQFVSDLVQPILHPIDTAVALKNVGHGVLEKTGLMSGKEHIPYADAVGKFIYDRYGNMENFKNTMATDPVGVASDLSMVLSGGATMAGRVPSVSGKLATAARAVDPLTTAAGIAKGVGKAAAVPIGLMTGTEAGPIKIAAQSGYKGGSAAQDFQQSMRGVLPAEDIVLDARKAVGNLRKERGSVYREGMADIAANTDVLNFDKIDKAIKDTAGVKTFKGQVISPKTQGIRNEITSVVNDWKALDPVEFHTAEGLDALKQKIGDIRDATQYGTSERLIADRSYNAIKNTIIEQATPEYAKVMKGYENASNQIKEIERTLSLNPKASVDTALRKLQSILRNNVNTNYGNRTKLAEYLVNAGAPNLMEKIAGHSLSSWTARGLGKLAMQLGAEVAAIGAGTAAGVPLAAAPLLATMSPRLMGEAAYYSGKAASMAPPRSAVKTSFQAGRVAREPLKVTVYAKPQEEQRRGGVVGHEQRTMALISRASKKAKQ